MVIEVPLNKTELSDRLHHLDPGAAFPIEEEGMLTEAFEAGSLSDQVIESIATFALKNRCTFTSRLNMAAFVKDGYLLTRKGR